MLLGVGEMELERDSQNPTDTRLFIPFTLTSCPIPIFYNILFNAFSNTNFGPVSENNSISNKKI